MTQIPEHNNSPNPLVGRWPSGAEFLDVNQIVRAIELATANVTHELSECGCDAHAALESMREGIQMWTEQRRQRQEIIDTHPGPPPMMDSYPGIYDRGE